MYVLKEISPGISLEGMMLKLKLQYLATSWEELTHRKDSDAGRDWRQEEKGTTEDEMAGWHHQLDGRESEWTLGDGDAQGSLACCDSWGCKESDMTERLNWTELRHSSASVVTMLACVGGRSLGRSFSCLDYRCVDTKPLARFYETSY